MGYKRLRDLVACTWNVRSLVENSGDIRVCRKRCLHNGVSAGADVVDKKLDLLVGELQRYGVSVAGIQETKWFGKDIWPASYGYTLLHSGRPIPGDSDIVNRQEGVGILLDKRASAAWRRGGEVWKAVSSRLISMRLRWASSDGRRSSKARGSFVTIVCGYAPTARGPSCVKSMFLEELQNTLDAVPENDILLLLGDFNARIGVRDSDDGLWSNVIGGHGLEERNLAGEEFLQVCELNQLLIMNTWFQKKQIHYGTWMHPATKLCHMIDFIVMRQSQRMCCIDVQVMRGANCWTDHYLVRVRLRIALPRYSDKQQRPLPFAVHKFAVQGVLDSYRRSLELALNATATSSGCAVEDSWHALRSCIVSSAETSIGRGKRSDPEWFTESSETLNPLIEAKNKAHLKFLQIGTRSCRQRFRKCQRMVKKAVDKAKEKWILTIATEGEEAVKDGRVRWNCVHRLQRISAGRRPVRPTAVLKEDGELTQGPTEVLERWHQHFKKLLNVKSVFNVEVINAMAVLPLRLDLDYPPTMEELDVALSKLKKNKAGGLSGILPELVLFGGPALWDRLLLLLRDIWGSGHVVDDWRNALIVPVPKKGNLQSCDNWRGISLLDVIGKILARIIQDRLQVIAESILPDSQSGFRKGRGCLDMIFVARQLMEKAREHGDSLYVMFVDLKKAYDSVPREALWQVLQKCGVPPQMLEIIKSFHEGMCAEVRVGHDTTDCFEVKNGLRQGCTMAPTLFNIYFNAMVSCWRDECGEAGVMVLYKLGRRLVGDRTVKSKLHHVKITDATYTHTHTHTHAHIHTYTHTHTHTHTNCFLDMLYSPC